MCARLYQKQPLIVIIGLMGSDLDLPKIDPVKWGLLYYNTSLLIYSVIPLMLSFG